MSKSISQELIRSADQIRQKYKALKRGQFNIEEQRLEELKPILEPLNKLVEKEEKPVARYMPPTIRTPSRIPAIQTRPAPPTLQFGKIAAKYLSKYLSQEASSDKTFGIRSANDKFYIGSQEVEVANDDVTIGNKTYVGTDGLWQLLTMKDPQNYSNEDLAKYKEIIIITNAHKKRYEADQPIAGNKGTKYNNIIKPLFTTGGEGLLREVTNNKIDHVYWDDPNELVNRLRLLVLSKRAGNTGVDNEIQSIIEELTEAKIII